MNKPNKAGDTPLIIATKAGHTSIVERLLKKQAHPQKRADPHLADFNKYTPLKWAAHLGRSAIIEELIFNHLSQHSKQLSEYCENTGIPYFNNDSTINVFGNQIGYHHKKKVDEAYRFGLTGKVDPHQLQAKIQMNRALEFADEVWTRKISAFEMKDFEEALCIAKAQGNDWTVQVLRAHGVNEGDEIELDHPSDSSSSLV